MKRPPGRRRAIRPGAPWFAFWRGTSYIPHWVTENGIWYDNEFTEAFPPGMVGSAEPMSDKQCRFSHVRILENVALIVKGWGDGVSSLTLDGRPVVRGSGLRVGHVRRLEGTDLVVFVTVRSTTPVRFVLGEAR